MTTFLERLVAERRADARLAAGRRFAVGEHRSKVGEPVVDDSELKDAPAPRSLALAIEARRPTHLAVIAEVKRRSPGSGEVFGRALDVVELARRYESAGAAAISVLTEPRHWGGSFEDLRAVRAAVRIPVLCKDVIVDAEQIYEARKAGADAVLLIAEALDDQELRRLSALTTKLGMEPLVEAHDTAAFARAVATGARVVGANARDLREPGSIDRSRARLLHTFVRAEQLFVAESGISSVDDLAELPARTDAILVGSALMRADDPGVLVRQLATAKRHGTSTPTTTSLVIER